MYVLGFAAFYVLTPHQDRARRLGLKGGVLQDLLFYMALGLVIGARIGYVLIYQFSNLGEYLRNPIEFIAVWHGGMSFHGGLVGCVIAALIFSARRGIPFWDLADALIVPAPLGLFFGRLGNFINGELFGRTASVPWAMVFPEGGPRPRHPSQLYEALLEGAVLFLILWGLRNRNYRPGTMASIFLVGYGISRFFVEFFREPDGHIGLFWGFFTMGQFLCLAMILGGCLILCLRRRSKG